MNINNAHNKSGKYNCATFQILSNIMVLTLQYKHTCMIYVPIIFIIS